MPRWRFLVPFALVVSGLLYTGLQAQAMYRWVDKDGRVHYSQQPPAPGAAKSVEQKQFGRAGHAESQLPYALQRAVKNYPVVLYTAPGCKRGCAEARALLARRGVPFREVSVSDAKTAALLKRVSGGNRVPVLSVGSVVQKGYRADAFNNALDTAGYPRTPAPGLKPAPAARP